jgi:pyruvate formate lyase activating enzyme
MPLGSVCLTKTTLIDYPGKVAAVVFTPGCNLRCPYCHNPELVDGSIPEEAISFTELDAFLDKRRNVLEGVCITGGEPLMHQDLADLIDLIHFHGLAVKLDTNGMFPRRLAQQKCEFIALDVKTVPSKYHLVGAESGEPVLESIQWILSSGIDHEFRTTMAPGIIDEEDLTEIAELVEGTKNYTLTSFRPGITLDPAYSSKTPYSREDLEKFADTLGEKGIPVHLRLGTG